MELCCPFQTEWDGWGNMRWWQQETRNCNIKPRISLGMHWGAKEKSQSFTFHRIHRISGDFVLFHLQEGRKLCSCRDITWEKHGREFVSCQEKVEGKMLDLKAVSLCRGLKFMLAMNKMHFKHPHIVKFLSGRGHLTWGCVNFLISFTWLWLSSCIQSKNWTVQTEV